MRNKNILCAVCPTQCQDNPYIQALEAENERLTKENTKLGTEIKELDAALDEYERC